MAGELKAEGRERLFSPRGPLGLEIIRQAPSEDGGLCLALQREEHRVSSHTGAHVDGPARGEAGRSGLRSSQQLHKDAGSRRDAFVAAIRLGSAEY